MDQPDHDLVGDRRRDDGLCPLSGARRDGVAERIVATASSLFEPLAQADLGWLSAVRLRGWLPRFVDREPSCVPVLGVRFLLGLAEAGFYPGVIVYLTHWFPRGPHQGTRLVLHRHAGCADRRTADLGPIMLSAWGNPHGPRPGRLAVGFHRLGYPGRDPGLLESSIT